MHHEDHSVVHDDDIILSNHEDEETLNELFVH